MKGETTSPRDNFYYYDVRKAVAVRYQQWKYSRRHTTDISTYWPTKQGPFLFDLQNDPNESYSLIEAQPALASHLATMLDTFEDDMQANLRGWL